MLIRFLKDTSGATAIEYSVISAMVGIIAVGAITLFGSEVGGLHDGVASQVSTASGN